MFAAFTKIYGKMRWLRQNAWSCSRLSHRAAKLNRHRPSPGPAADVNGRWFGNKTNRWYISVDEQFHTKCAILLPIIIIRNGSALWMSRVCRECMSATSNRIKHIYEFFDAIVPQSSIFVVLYADGDAWYLRNRPHNTMKGNAVNAQRVDDKYNRAENVVGRRQ